MTTDRMRAKELGRKAGLYYRAAEQLKKDGQFGTAGRLVRLADQATTERIAILDRLAERAKK